ncbi:MAG: M28 family peptidase [Planctomycetes bacterium]|nr:M28 family peptidase [Planctomycetota bacterium]
MRRFESTPITAASLTLSWALLFAAPAGAQPVTVDPRVSSLVAQVSKGNIQNAVSQLSSFHTRRSDQPEALLAKNWLVARFQAIPGVTVTTETFQAGYAPNIICELPGATHPERILVLGAHYDSINEGGAEKPAPGADDNASGAAGLLEAARVLAQGQFEATIRVVLFAAEEFNLDGSSADAQGLVDSGAQVLGMLNLDMISYRQAGDAYDVDFILGATDTDLTQFCMDVTSAYLPWLGVKSGFDDAGDSDHHSYQSRGIPSVFFFEDFNHFSPWIHTAKDATGKSANDFDLAHDITRSLVASAASLAQPVDLDILHAPLAGSADSGGPYATSATVASFTSYAVASVDLVYRAGAGAWTTTAMVKSATTGAWLGSIPGLPGHGNVDYYIHATDSAGYAEWTPEAKRPGDACFRFKVGTITPIFQDDFEAPGENGWVSVKEKKEDDWQKGKPQGASGFDPSAAASGHSARGNDLGLAGLNGKYKAKVENYLESPPIDCTGRTGVLLRYQRWLTVEDGFYDQARIKVNNQTVWTNAKTPGGGAQHTVDKAWTLHEVDVSALADDNPSVRVRFQLKSDGGLQFGGWTLDDFRLVTVGDGTVAPLVASRSCLSAAQGGTVQFSIDAGAQHAHRPYIVGISGTGSAPATVVDGTPIPLVFDAVTQAGLQLMNSQILADFGGTLSATGTATATLALPGGSVPALAGLRFHFAAFTLAPVTWASNAVSLEFGL